RAELVRTFVREACLCEDVPQETASSIAEHTSEIWRALCEKGASDAVRILTPFSGQNVKVRILLPAYSRVYAFLTGGRRLLSTDMCSLLAATGRRSSAES